LPIEDDHVVNLIRVMMTVDEIANFDMIRAPRLITVVYEMRTESLRIVCEPYSFP
jgi:hypothetical protein